MVTMTPSDATAVSASAKGVNPKFLAFLFFVPAFAMVCGFQGIQQILIPLQIQKMDALHKIADLAGLTVLSAAFATVGILLGGAWSDRTHSALGRRSPWLIGMGLVSCGLMIVASYAHTLPV